MTRAAWQTMPIERGEDWGWPATGEELGRHCVGDRALAQAISEGVGLVGLSGGDVARTLGLSGDSPDRPSTWHVPIDAMRVYVDGDEPVIAAAHVRIGTWASADGWHAAMNAAFVGSQNLAPRAHPGDGLFDLVTSIVEGWDRLKAWRRAATGTHVPHPQITMRRVGHSSLNYDRPRRISIDGERPRRAQHVRIEIVPNAIAVAV